MLIWFVAFGVIVVMIVFDSPAIDYRFVVCGSVLPLFEALTGSPWLLHTLLGSIVLLVVVMGLTIGRRLLRRRWLGLPIGTFIFLVASGVWSRTALFWWPFAGSEGIGHGRPPEFDRPLALLIVMELAGLAALVWLAVRADLRAPANRRSLWETGRLPRIN